MKRKINLVLMILVILAAMFAAAEVKQHEEKINWKPTEVYEFTNKNISWD